MKKTRTNPPESWAARDRQLYEEFAQRLRQKLRSPGGYLRSLLRFFPRQAEKGLAFRDFPASFLGHYASTLTLSSRNRWVSALKAWTRFLYRRKELLWPVYEELGLYCRPARRRDGSLTYEQVQQILQLPPLDQPLGLRDRAMLEVAYACGLRHSELLGLELSDLELEPGQIWIRQSKNDQPRVLPLTSWARHFLRRYLEEVRSQWASPLSSNALWLTLYGRPASNPIRPRLRKVYRVAKVLGVPFCFHLLRHACASHLLQGGASLRHVQEMLGHRDLNSTAIYTHLSPHHLKDVLLRLHPRNGPLFALPGEGSPPPSR